MGCLKTIQLKKFTYSLFSLLLTGWTSLYSIELQAQFNYDIRLVQSSSDLESKQVCFEVQLKSATSESWELGGQNYRLYYDSGNASFIAGKSLLGSKYKSFKLVQDAQNIDASDINGELDFESNLGFLNYAIDLLDATGSAKQLPTDGTWLSTTEICFQLEDLSDEEAFNFSLVWARYGQTEVYATSFLEISSRLGTNEFNSATGNNYEDWFSEESFELESNSNIMIEPNYDIRLLQKSIDLAAGQVCFDVQLSSTNSKSWELAGQNYRLYYDTEKASFITGKSLLGDKYQAFEVIDDLQNIDASSTNGPFDFNTNVGFLNYAIDLLDLTSSATLVPVDGTWLSTTELCFQLEDFSDEETFNFSLVWARQEQTDRYATSFVEIARRIDANQLTTATGNVFQDWYSSIASQGVVVQAKTFLQGAFDHNTGLMRDKLRALNYLPLESIYSEESFPENIAFRPINQKKEILSSSVVFQTDGENAIVDWVFLELRDKAEVGKVIATRSALIQRDGDIVDLDGESPVKFSVASDAYHLVIRHRNHLGIMSKEPIDFEQQIETIDFTDPQTPTYGEHARKVENGIALMWGGNADQDEYIIFQGGGTALPDTDYIFFDVFSDELNIHNRYNHIVKGYYFSDLNMDGEIRYQGSGNDIEELLFFNVFSHPQNPQFFSNFYIQEQVPPRVE